ncbi:MAG: hypothetical protein WBF04_13510 [Candidatus Sulfotelmatobacter sp.]
MKKKDLPSELMDDIGANVELGSVEHARTPRNHKQPYEKPVVRHDKVFVNTALSCGKITAGTCGMMNTKVS